MMKVVTPQPKSARPESAAAEQSTPVSVEEYQAALQALAQAQEREKRLLADYQNLQRHSREERQQLVKMANKEFCLGLLQPLEHLQLATEQIQNPGLTMVTEQFWRSLKELGLEKIEVLGKAFDLATMEVVEKRGKAEKVLSVVRNGYRLNGEIIQHAQVVLG